MLTRNKNKKKANSPNPRPPDPHLPDHDPEPPTHVENVPEPREETNAEDYTMDIVTSQYVTITGRPLTTIIGLSTRSTGECDFDDGRISRLETRSPKPPRYHYDDQRPNYIGKSNCV
jgi:hypothetical protein